MENDITESEAAFLAWLNSLNLHPTKLTSVQELKDGVFLISLLNKVYEIRLFNRLHSDKEHFPTVGFNLFPNETKWYASNVAKLTRYVNTYLNGFLKQQIDTDYLDVQLIAENGNKLHLLQLVIVTD